MNLLRIGAITDRGLHVGILGFPGSGPSQGRLTQPRKTGKEGLRFMKQAVVIDGQEQVLDTDIDALLYAAPRAGAEESSAYQRGRDMYLHETETDPGIFYIHLWSRFPGETETVMVLPNRQADRYFGERILECASLPGLKAYSTLTNWGYGIPEEF